MTAPQKQRQKKAGKSSSVIRKVSIDHQGIAQAKADDLARLNSTLKTADVQTTATPSAETAATRMTDAFGAMQTAEQLEHPAQDGIAAQPAAVTATEQPTTALQSEPQSDQQSVQQPQPRLPNWCHTTGEWHALAEAVVGLAHRDAKVALPCQDAAIAQAGVRPLVIACDGAGSAAVSELGSQALTVGLGRLVHTLELQFSQLLDQSEMLDHDDFAREMVRTLLRHAKGILQDLAARHRREVRDFRSTVLLAVIGRKRWLWLKVGDGAN
jgi:hypothetical protein